MGTQNVQVSFDYNGGSPVWNVPDVTVNHGNMDTIQWNLSCTNLPAGATARFSNNQPINFVTRKNNVNGATWTGPIPTRVNDSEVTVVDDNRGPSQTATYYYNVTIDLMTGGVGVAMTDDPQVENPGG